MPTGCDIIEDWEDTDYSGPGGRFEQLSDFIDSFMERYGFASEVAEQPGLMDDEGVPAHYDPDSNTIFLDPDYFASEDISPDEAINLAIHESIHAMDVLEDGSLDVPEGEVARAAFHLGQNETDDCESVEPTSGAGNGNTGGW